MMSIELMKAMSKATISLRKEKFRTYPFSDADPFPATGERRYPYFLYANHMMKFRDIAIRGRATTENGERKGELRICA